MTCSALRRSWGVVDAAGDYWTHSGEDNDLKLCCLQLQVRPATARCLLCPSLMLACIVLRCRLVDGCVCTPRLVSIGSTMGS